MNRSKSTETMTIKQAADQCGVGVETVRFYERENLIPSPPRTPSGYRIYSEDTIARIQFIKRAQKLGFSLPEIRELLAMKVRRGAKQADFKETARRKIETIDEKIKVLQKMKKILTEMTQACHGTGPLAECPILNALECGHKGAAAREAL